MHTQTAAAAMEPIAHNNDPGTSHLAAGHIEETGELSAQQQVVCRLVRQDPGKTCAELARLHQRELGDRSMDTLMLVRRRVTDLVRKGVCEYGARKRCAVMGNPASSVWPKRGQA